MTTLSEPVIAEIKILYEESGLPVRQIAADHGIAPQRLSRLAKQRNWKLRKKPSAEEARAALSLRICEVINMKLDQMEKAMASGELSSADHERDAKSLASMIGGMDKAASAENESKKRKPKLKSAASEVERLQREIIERFERIQRRRDAERKTG
jgi:hypothetical protein